MAVDLVRWGCWFCFWVKTWRIKDDEDEFAIETLKHIYTGVWYTD